VLHLHVAASFVVTEIVADGVPAVKILLFVGAVIVAIGGVISDEEGGVEVGGVAPPDTLPVATVTLSIHKYWSTGDPSPM
jgi:hypothetical protein